MLLLWPAIVSVLLAICERALARDSDWQSPVYKNLFSVALPIPEVKVPIKSYPYEGAPTVDYYEVEIKPLEAQLYPGLSKTKLVGYDGRAPGPTFKMTKGREAVIRFINNADMASSVHLHGSYSRAPFDGWAEDEIQPGQYKDYYYPNGQSARTLWYHDQAIDHTAHNAYFGQAGFYILHDAEELAVPGLPQGDYDISLALAAKRYNADGTLWDPDVNGETTSLYGDVIHVNGQPWPFLAVEPCKYRFRFLDSSVSRSFQLYFENPAGKRVSFYVVGSDAGLLTRPVQSSQLDISMAERWEVVFDFTQCAGKNVTLRNMRDVGADEDYNSTDKVMRFVVGNKVTSQEKNEALPASLRTVPFPPPKAGVDRRFKFERSGGEWVVNGVNWHAGPEQRVLAKPERGAIEVWELENSSGGWTHPVHIHLVDFQILSRSGGERNSVLPYEQAALKDVVWLNRGETVRVIARYAPWDGLYMFHCHNLIHEDSAMMVALNITALAGLGYNETTRFLDPMDPKYRAIPFASSDYTNRVKDFDIKSIDAKCDVFTHMDAYAHVGDTVKALDDYWSSRGSGRATTTTAKSSTTTRTALVTTTTLVKSTTTKSAQTTTKAAATTKSSGKGSGRKRTARCFATCVIHHSILQLFWHSGSQYVDEHSFLLSSWRRRSRVYVFNDRCLPSLTSSLLQPSMGHYHLAMLSGVFLALCPWHGYECGLVP
ncbi:hypothetical protein TI39_contig4207g00004 [Zymoseptoria brevis]|uniref:Uncharacterized protein n=1 Tax=Zymoseptoria brevis TaxID=1047168 RepID=A0A0F4GA20_9PEZI|nr:hypothetical protein TI39_contig4207g00004 [Zymoseptoria brevis]